MGPTTYCQATLLMFCSEDQKQWFWLLGSGVKKKKYYLNITSIINRLGAVYKYFCHWFSHSLTHSFPSEILRKHSPPTPCQLSGVTCHISNKLVDLVVWRPFIRRTYPVFSDILIKQIYDNIRCTYIFSFGLIPFPFELILIKRSFFFTFFSLLGYSNI